MTQPATTPLFVQQYFIKLKLKKKERMEIVSGHKFWNNTHWYMALPASTPLQRTVFTLYNKCCFQLSSYICEKPSSLAYQDRKQLQDKPIIALKTSENAGTKKKIKFLSNRKPKWTQICVKFDLRTVPVINWDLVLPGRWLYK